MIAKQIQLQIDDAQELTNDPAFSEWLADREQESATHWLDAFSFETESAKRVAWMAKRLDELNAEEEAEYASKNI